MSKKINEEVGKPMSKREPEPEHGYVSGGLKSMLEEYGVNEKELVLAEHEDDAWSETEFNLKIDSENLRRFFKTIGELTSDFKLTLTPETALTCVGDPAIICLMKMRMDKDAFISYRIDKPVQIGVDTKTIIDFLKHVKRSSTIIIKKEKNTNYLQIEYIVDMATFRLKTQVVPLNTIRKQPKIPAAIYNIPLLGSLNEGQTASFKTFFQFISDTNKVCVEHTTTTLKIAPVDVDDVIELEMPVKMENGEQKKGYYSTEYLRVMTKNIRVGDTLQIYLKPKYPIWFKWSLWDNIHVDYIIAPRMEEGR